MDAANGVVGHDDPRFGSDGGGDPVTQPAEVGTLFLVRVSAVDSTFACPSRGTDGLSEQGKTTNMCR